LWKIIDVDGHDKLVIQHFRHILEAYEVWNYEKQQKAALEEVFGKKQTEEELASRSWLRKL